MRKFEKITHVIAEDLDELEHVNNVRYVQWIQDISKDHWQSLASEEIKKNTVWVVINHNITYKSAAKLNDELKIQTYIKESRGATCIRIVEMFDKISEKLIVRSKTEWCLLNAKTLKPMRISEKIRTIFL